MAASGHFGLYYKSEINLKTNLISLLAITVKDLDMVDYNSNLEIFSVL